MNFLKNILSIIGAIVIIGALVVFVKYNLKDKMDKASKLDPKAMSIMA
jgi:hypothetical protein